MHMGARIVHIDARNAHMGARAVHMDIRILYVGARLLQQYRTCFCV